MNCPCPLLGTGLVVPCSDVIQSPHPMIAQQTTWDGCQAQVSPQAYHCPHFQAFLVAEPLFMYERNLVQSEFIGQLAQV